MRMWHFKRSRSPLRWGVAILLVTSPSLADACRISKPPKFDQVGDADVVLIGRLENYRIIRDQAFRKEMLASPQLSAEARRFYEYPKQGLLPDYARFDVQVEQVLAGHVSSRVSVVWNNSMFPEPDSMPAGSYLIALRRSNLSDSFPSDSSAKGSASADDDALTVLQAPCSPAFIYGAESGEAKAILSALGSAQEQRKELLCLSSRTFLQPSGGNEWRSAPLECP